MPVTEQRPRWPIAIVATVALVVVAALIVYNLVPPTVAVPVVRPLPRAGVVFDSAGTRVGPAPALRGAHAGGTVQLLRPGPAPLSGSVPDADRSALRLEFRTLTGYLRTANGLELVGDLATDAGRASADGLTWTYHLRPGVRFEDGSAVLSTDVARGIDRYIRLRDLVRSRTPDPTTIVLTLTRPMPELPLLLSLLETAPAPPGPDTPATGPYRGSAPGILVRNPSWDPNSDPIRHAYPDRFVFDQATPATAGTLVSDTVPPGTPPGTTRVVGPTGVGVYILINTARVTDLNVRRALNYAIDRGAAADSLVDSAAVPMTTLLPALVRGPRTYDAYPAGLHGNLDKARRLLAGRFMPHLTLCADPDAATSTLDSAIVRSFARAGLTVTVSPVSLADYRPGTTVCDLIPITLSARYPDADQILGTLFGGQNYSNLHDPSVADQLSTLAAEPDRAAAGPGYVALDETIMRDLVPAVPVVEQTVQAVVGPRIATADVDPVSGALDLDSISVAPPS